MKFEELLEKHNFDYCIVGNSPCEFGRKNGKLIDSYSLVIRFNDFSLFKAEKLSISMKTEFSKIRLIRSKLLFPAGRRLFAVQLIL